MMVKLNWRNRFLLFIVIFHKSDVQLRKIFFLFYSSVQNLELNAKMRKALRRFVSHFPFDCTKWKVSLLVKRGKVEHCATCWEMLAFIFLTFMSVHKLFRKNIFHSDASQSPANYTSTKAFISCRTLFFRQAITSGMKILIFKFFWGVSHSYFPYKY